MFRGIAKDQIVEYDEKVVKDRPCSNHYEINDEEAAIFAKYSKHQSAEYDIQNHESRISTMKSCQTQSAFKS